jgi:hypothetical protein
VILMVIVIALTAVQFRFVERKVHYWMSPASPLRQHDETAPPLASSRIWC